MPDKNNYLYIKGYVHVTHMILYMWFYTSV